MKNIRQPVNRPTKPDANHLGLKALQQGQVCKRLHPPVVTPQAELMPTLYACTENEVGALTRLMFGFMWIHHQQ